jgi:predicted DNA-binding transcriptional regulator AlpA
MQDLLATHPSRLLSIDEAAAFIGVSVRTMRRYHNMHLIPPPIRLGGRLLLKWRLGDLVRFIDEQAEAVQ